MREFVVRALYAVRQLLNPCLGPMGVSNDADLEAERTALRQPVVDPLGGHDSTDDESSAARLSRRSSVLVDLISLFRRSSSSIGKSVRLAGQNLHDQGGEDDFDPEETKNMSKERVLEAIRQKKEVITKLRSQPWSMKRKLRTLKVARRYLQRQKQKVSKWHLWKVETTRRLTQFGRWCDNMKIYLIPWEAKIKGIESHYGSVVSSYFTFLRWVLSVNITMTVIMMLFVTIPEWLADSRFDPVRYNKTYNIKVMKPKDIEKADELNTVLDFKGYFEYSLLFYGYYSSETYFGDTVQYSVPVAYFVVNLFILGYSFFVILRKMASNARNSKLSGGKAEQYVFNWKLFTGWDYTIGNPDTATNVVMANVNKFREVIAEYNVNMKKKFDCLQLSLRIFANILVLILQAGSVWAILEVSQITTKTTFIERNAVSITVSFITLTFPNFYDLISKIERYHPRTTLRLQLARVLFLYIVNYYTLIVSLMFMLNTMESQRSGDQQLLVAAHYSDESLLLPFQHAVSASRTTRQVTFELPAGFSPFNASVFQAAMSTLPPSTTPWTTVLPKFGPFAVANPKVVVSSIARNPPNSSTFYTHPIGSSDWNKNLSSRPVPLNYSTSVRAITAQRLTTDWYEECWENLIGQEITKLVTMDLAMTIASILVIDFLRGLWVRYCNMWWFWNLECTFPEYGEFKVAENVLHLVNNQGMIWLGLFFVPMLPAINNIKLIVLMYIRAWAVMTCNVPARQIFRASRSSNFYLMLLLLMLFLCTLPVGYVIASKKPSKICGPFGSQETFYSVITQLLDKNLSKGLVEAIKYMTSPGIVIPVLLLLLLIIYFLFALVRGLREANSDLSNQLMHERTEEKKKIFELAGGGKKKTSNHSAGAHAKSTRRENSTKSSSGSNHSDEDRSPSQRSKDIHSFIPSLTSVSEEAHIDLTEGEPQRERQRTPPPKLTWKQRLMLCIGLTDLKTIKAHQPLEGHDNDAEEEDESPISGKKSTEHATSEDQRSYSSMTGSYTSRCVSDERSCSQSYYDCASTVNNEPGAGSEGRNHRGSPQKRSPDDMSSSFRHDASSGSCSDERSRTRESDTSPMSYMTARDQSSSSSPTHSAHKMNSNTLQVPDDHRKKHSALPRSDDRRSVRHSHSHSHTSSICTPSSSQRSIATSPQSLLEPLVPDNERSLRQLQYSDAGAYVDPAAPSSGEISFRDATPHRNRQPSVTRSQNSDESNGTCNESIILPAISARPEYLGLSDPRIVYSDPYSSYANAMMSPIIEMQTMSPTLSESDMDDDVERSTETTHLINNHSSRARDRERRHSKAHVHSQTPSTSRNHHEAMVRPPRFRISSSPKRHNVQASTDSDNSTREFLMRVKPSELFERSRSAAQSSTMDDYSRQSNLDGQPSNEKNTSHTPDGERATHDFTTSVPRSNAAQRSRHKNTYV
uniref:TMC family membrane protein n=1 Tax=Ascaris suum TaxID=6253 RepID=F1KR31_ASCSU